MAPTGLAFGEPDDKLLDEAIHAIAQVVALDCFASLAMTADLEAR